MRVLRLTSLLTPLHKELVKRELRRWEINMVCVVRECLLEARVDSGNFASGES